MATVTFRGIIGFSFGLGSELFMTRTAVSSEFLPLTLSLRSIAYGAFYVHNVTREIQVIDNTNAAPAGWIPAVSNIRDMSAVYC